MYDLTQVCVYWYLSFTVVQVGFVQATYTVMESDGQVSVCIDISGAILDRTVIVFASTTNETASCEWFLCLRWLIPFVYKMTFMYANSDTKRIYYMHLFLMRFHVASDDYTPVDSQPVAFNSAPSQMCISITILNDFIIEPNELFTVTLDSTDPAVQLTLPTASVTILDSCK